MAGLLKTGLGALKNTALGSLNPSIAAAKAGSNTRSLLFKPSASASASTPTPTPAPAKATLTYPYNGNTKKMRINRNGNTFNLTLTNNGKGIKSGSVTKKGQTKRNFTVANITKNKVGNVAPVVAPVAASAAKPETPVAPAEAAAAETPKNRANKIAKVVRDRIEAEAKKAAPVEPATPAESAAAAETSKNKANKNANAASVTNGSPIGLPIPPKLPTVEDAEKAKDNATKYVKNLSPNAPLPTMDDLMGKYRALTSTNAGEIIDTAEKKRKSNSDIGNLIRGGRSRRHKKHKSHKKRVAKRKTRKVNRRRY
jgi:hypothetical protein